MIAKSITKEAVKMVAEELFAQNVTTTTLEVKQLLRLKGFDARQKEISSLMEILEIEQGWLHTFKNRHKVYWKNR